MIENTTIQYFLAKEKNPIIYYIKAVDTRNNCIVYIEESEWGNKRSIGYYDRIDKDLYIQDSNNNYLNDRELLEEFNTQTKEMWDEYYEMICCGAGSISNKSRSDEKYELELLQEEAKREFFKCNGFHCEDDWARWMGIED